MLGFTPRPARLAPRGKGRTAGSLIALGVFLAYAGGCASTRMEPLTSQTDPALLKQDERTLWTTADRLEGQIATHVEPVPDHEQAERYLAGVVQKLTPDFNNPAVHIRIRILPDPSPNAFVLPNGAMYVNSGLLALLDNEAQIATVLGHEFAHFQNRHSYREKIKEDNEMIKGALFGGALSVLAGGSDGLNSAADLWRISSVSGYSRRLESEADHCSLVAVLRAGYEPEQAFKAFERLQTIAEKDEEQDMRFATHPRLSERIASYRKCLQDPEIQQQATGRLVAEDVYEDKLFAVILENAKLNLDDDNYTQAQANIRRCLRVEPQSARAHFLAGELERTGPTGTSNAALDSYARALRHDPNCVEAHREIGLLQRELGERDKAGESLRVYLAEADDAPDAPLIKRYIETLADPNASIQPPYRPLEVDAKTLRDKAKTIGVIPLFLPDGVVEPDKRKEEFEQTLVAKLTEAGFTVVPPSAYEAIHESMKKTLGALYDPNTGKPIEERQDLVVRHALREYVRTHRIDAVAYPALITVAANWQMNRAEWHGVREASTGKEGFWADMAAPSAYGTIPALSFRTHIMSTYGELCYLGFGGIQLCSRVAGGRFIDVPTHELLTDSAKNERSVDLACQALFKESE